MANEIQQKLDAVGTITITLATPLASGAIRYSAAIDNSVLRRPGALLSLRIMVGATPVVGSAINIYLLRDNGSGYLTDGWGGIDATIVPPGTVMNAKLLGSIFVPAATPNVQYFKDIDTLQAGAGILGHKWGIAIENATGFALNAVAGNHVCQQTMYVPEIQ
jgi:hypothetical protein